jgi:small subunit ribosomal protein S1
MNRRLKVIRSPYTGYCFGVKRAMNMIEQAISNGSDKIYTLGDIIHNPQAIRRLEDRGIKSVSSVNQVEFGSTIVLRAHGVRPEVVSRARERGIIVMDATCPFVQRSQRYVKKLLSESFDIIILGDRKHPEVQSISGYADDQAVVINSPEEAKQLRELEKAGIVIQTTLERDNSMEIIDILKERVQNLRIYDTICKATVLRRESTMELSGKVDIMLVVGGKNSANTRRLYSMCLNSGIETKFIETDSEIDPSWFDKVKRVGVTTGTSTPDWVIEGVLKKMEEISSQ